MALLCLKSSITMLNPIFVFIISIEKNYDLNKILQILQNGSHISVTSFFWNILQIAKKIFFVYLGFIDIFYVIYRVSRKCIWKSHECAPG